MSRGDPGDCDRILACRSPRGGALAGLAVLGQALAVHEWISIGVDALTNPVAVVTARPRRLRPAPTRDLTGGPAAARLTAAEGTTHREAMMQQDRTRVSVAGATGWTGRPIAEAVRDAEDLELVSAAARSAAGTDLGHAWGSEAIGVGVHGTVSEALDDADVLVDYTSHAAVAANVRAALEHGVSVVIGSSGLTGHDYVEIDALAREHAVGAVAAGNFSLTAAMAQAAAALVTAHLPHWEIIDYASARKPDAPSGTARELAERLAEVRQPHTEIPVEQIAGAREARGATVAGTQIHSLRLPSFVVSTEVVFALPDERLTIRHDAGGTPQPYVAGTLLAIRAVRSVVGLVRGLDTLLLSNHDQKARRS